MIWFVEKIEATIPGFLNYNQRVRIPGADLPYPTTHAKMTLHPRLLEKPISAPINPRAIPLENHQFLMMTIRTHDQYNTTIYGLDDRYRGVLNERRIIFMNHE